ncbi:hypothetical protein ACTID9_03685 [Brevibacillus fluminis]|uniref:hypothetical protein n=1 Tax=Brevibacillus fluminis TaxID=511487 RepID=UPI003F8A1EA8
MSKKQLSQLYKNTIIHHNMPAGKCPVFPEKIEIMLTDLHFRGKLANSGYFFGDDVKQATMFKIVRYYNAIIQTI